MLTAHSGEKYVELEGRAGSQRRVSFSRRTDSLPRPLEAVSSQQSLGRDPTAKGHRRPVIGATHEGQPLLT